MMKLKFTFFVCLLLILLSMKTEAQVKFTAAFSPDRIGRDDVTSLSFSVENAQDIQRIIPPSLSEFIIVGGPNQSNGTNVINGDYKQFYSIEYIIKPRGAGTFTVNSATAIADGKSYTSNRATLKVVKAAHLNRPGSTSSTSQFNPFSLFDEPPQEASYGDNTIKNGENAVDKIKKNLFVKLETDRTSCYVGEPIIASYKLYTRLKSESIMSKNPSFNGFSVIDLGQQGNLQPQIGKLNGREYNVYTIRKVQLYPLRPGNLELETAEVDNTVQFMKVDNIKGRPNSPDDMFSGLGGEGIESHKLAIQSNPLTILVRPLPDAGKPEDFKGAVGDFTLKAGLSASTFSTDESGTLILALGGKGNLQLITAPEISWPAEIDGYDPKLTDDLDKSTVPVSGRKLIEYPFTVSKAGDYTLPSIRFSYFDPGEERYITLETKPLSFTVTPGAGKPKAVLTGNPQPAEQSMLNRFFKNRLRVVSVVAALILIGLIVWLKWDRKKQKQVDAEIEEVTKQVKEAELAEEQSMMEMRDPLAVSETKLNSNNGNEFFIALNQDLKNYIASKLKIPAEELNRKNITEQIDKKGISNETSLQLQKLIDELDWQLYTPFSENEKRVEMFERTREMIQLLETYKI